MSGPVAQRANFAEGVFAVRFGGWMRFRIAGDYRPLFLDLGAEYHRNGVACCLVEGGLTENPDGSITLTPQ